MSHAAESIFTAALFESIGETWCFEFGRQRRSPLAALTYVVLASAMGAPCVVCTV